MTAEPPHDDADWGPEHLRQALDAAGVALWSWKVDTDIFLMDAHGFKLWDIVRDGSLTFEDMSEKVHPSDRDRVRAAFSATRVMVGPYEIDFRILAGSDVRWISARGKGSDAGITDRAVTGIFLDVTGRKQAEEGHELLAGEMSHRVKNLLAVASGLTHITSRSSTSIEDMAKQLTERLTALGRAHDLVRRCRATRAMRPCWETCLRSCWHPTMTKAPFPAASAWQCPAPVSANWPQPAWRSWFTS